MALPKQIGLVKEITATHEDLIKAGCKVTQELNHSLVAWPPQANPPVSKVRSLSETELKVVHQHLNPSMLEQRLQDLGVPYNVRIFDPKQESLPATIQVTRTVTVTVKELRRAGFSVRTGTADNSWSVDLQDTGETLWAPQVVKDDLYVYLSFMFTDLPSPFEREMDKYQVDRNVLTKIRYDRPAPAPQKVVSIQVAATLYADGKVEVVNQHDIRRNFWSVYLRFEDGTVEHVTDHTIRSADGGYNAAIQTAAKLSMQNQVPIEPIP